MHDSDFAISYSCASGEILLTTNRSHPPILPINKLEGRKLLVADEHSDVDTWKKPSLVTNHL